MEGDTKLDRGGHREGVGSAAQHRAKVVGVDLHHRIGEVSQPGAAATACTGRLGGDSRGAEFSTSSTELRIFVAARHEVSESIRSADSFGTSVAIAPLVAVLAHEIASLGPAHCLLVDGSHSIRTLLRVELSSETLLR